MRQILVWWLVFLCIPFFMGFASNDEEISPHLILDESFATGGFEAFPWILGGTVYPFLQSLEIFHGEFALQFGEIGDDQESTIEIQVEISTPKWLSFYFKVSSEKDFDFLEFYDGTQQIGSWSGITDWEEFTHYLSPGQHTLLWKYSKDFSDREGLDTAWIDQISIGEAEEPPDIAQWLEEYGLGESLWVLGGSAFPFLQSRETFIGDYAFQFGAIEDDQESTIEIKVELSEPHHIIFYKKVSSERDYDFLEFYVGTQRIGSWSGITDWQEFAHYLSPGQHTLLWRYTKDYSDREGRDTAWIDQISFVEAQEPPDIAQWLEGYGFENPQWVLGGSAPPFLQSREIFQGEFALQFGAIEDDQDSTIEIQVELSEPQQISFYHKVSSEMDFDFLEFYVDSQQIRSWSGTTDWRKHSHNLPQGQHTLLWKYTKDCSFSEGQDTAWIDRISIGEALPPSVRHQVSPAVDGWKTSTMVLVDAGKRIAFSLPGDLVETHDDEMVDFFDHRLQVWEQNELGDEQVMIIMIVDDTVEFYFWLSIDEMLIETDNEIEVVGYTGRKVVGYVDEMETKAWLLLVSDFIQIEEESWDLLFTIIATEEYVQSNPGFSDRIIDSLDLFPAFQ